MSSHIYEASRTCPSTQWRTCRVESSEDWEAVARLRYRVYVEEMSRKQVHADHEARTILEPIDQDSLTFGTFLPNGSAIGTLRLTPSTSSRISQREVYGWEDRERAFPGKVALSSKLIVDPAFRGSPVSLHVIRATARGFCEAGWRFCFLDTNQHLVPLYTRLGYVPRAVRSHPLYGEVTIMELDSHDLAHHQSVRSPLLPEFSAFLERIRGAA